MVDVVTIGNATLYHGDCRDIIPALPPVDCVVTDPPYSYDGNEFYFPVDAVDEALAAFIASRHCLVFYPSLGAIAGTPTAVHVWHKAVPIHPNSETGNVAGHHYERIAEYNGRKKCRVFRAAAIMPNFAACAAELTPHPTQKPLNLMQSIVSETKGTVFDPFTGSGSTGVACVVLGRPFVGVEIQRKYFDIACERIAAAQSQGRLFA
jgi:DNA modification methylase